MLLKLGLLSVLIIPHLALKVPQLCSNSVNELKDLLFQLQMTKCHSSLPSYRSADTGTLCCSSTVYMNLGFRYYSSKSSFQNSTSPQLLVPCTGINRYVVYMVSIPILPQWHEFVSPQALTHFLGMRCFLVFII